MMQFNQHHLSVSVLSEGRFSSFFENRVTQAQKDSLQQHLGVAFVAKGMVSKQIIISDADIFTNKVDKTNGPMPMGMIPFESYQFANRDFFMNVIQYLNEPGGILESRNKGIVLRVLDKTKVQESRVFWQLLLLLGPLFILAILYLGWNRYRQGRFGA